MTKKKYLIQHGHLEQDQANCLRQVVERPVTALGLTLVMQMCHPPRGQARLGGHGAASEHRAWGFTRPGALDIMLDTSDI